MCKSRLGRGGFFVETDFCASEKRQTIGLVKHNMDTTVYFVNKKINILSTFDVR